MAKLTIPGVCTCSYPHLFQPNANANGGDPKYSCTVLIPKTEKKAIDAIKKAIADARAEFCAKNGAQALPTQPKHTLYDGDGTRPSGDPFGEECKGHYVITVSSKNKPLVVDRNGNEILDANEVYAGCKIRVNVNFYGYNSNGNKGITAGLNAVQKWADGEPIGGGHVTADVFDDGFTDGEGDDSWI